MARLVILGATGTLGRHVLRQALADGHEVSIAVRSPSRLPSELAAHVVVHAVDLLTIEPIDLASIVGANHALINCAGHVSDGERFVDLVDRVVTAVERVPAARPVCWFLAGSALLDIGTSGRRGVELPKVRSTYWPHRANFERLSRSPINWRLLCPGPMVEEPVLGLDRLRTSIDRLPVDLPPWSRVLPAPLLLPLFASVVPQMIVSYADAAALMLANIVADSAMTQHRVGIALPAGMRGRKPQWLPDQFRRSHPNTD